ncbi:hypothetical protein BDP27DRAFT_1457995 [Rhodocollybia butyracea]|uniref:Uncharacterized protein n=1 Tax=Rhodocollybia butyracea TaxID=206335 RepID=A0A9P5TVI6_9AGAR|nr:hypothetical protein BDP27DRAFT_1457995 [Rhodocollybia butyracea]
MRFVLLLFTLIAGSMIVVCPLPMDSQAGSLLVQTEPVVITLINGKTGLKMERTGVTDKKTPDKKTRTAIGYKRRAFTHIFTQALGTKPKATPQYEGLYAPRYPEGRRWIYFTLTGWAPCIGQPCFGWIAYGQEFKANGHKGHMYRQRYIGISSGLPASYSFNEIVGGSSLEGAMKKEWKILMEEFIEYFMTPTKPTVTFVDDEGTPKLVGKQNRLDEHQFSKDISEALNPSLEQDPESTVTITFKFKGYHDPSYYHDPVPYYSNPYRKWRYFELIGGHEHCTTLSPCFGFATDECLVIVKPISQPDPKSARFNILGVKLGIVPGVSLPDMVTHIMPGIMKKFETQFHVWAQEELDMAE